MSRLERAATYVWEAPGVVPSLARLALTPASVAYGLVVRARLGLYAIGLWHSARVPAWVVSVGNLRVGGTGKTPLTLWVAEQFQARGHRVAIVARGYRKQRPGVVLVSRGDGPLVTADAGGDEAVMLAHRFRGPIVTAERRVEAARWATTALGVDVIVLDDGFQHWGLARDRDIVVVPAGDGATRLLPAGPLREAPAALARAHAVVTIGEPTPPRSASTHRATIVPDALVRVVDGQWIAGPLASLSGQDVVLVTGIARPERVRQTVLGAGATIREHWAFPDHHRFRDAELARIRSAAERNTVIMTEKDFVRCPPEVQARVAALRVRLEVAEPAGLLAALLPVASRRE